MTNSWDEMRKAKEDSFFKKQNDQAMERLAKRQAEKATRKSPITGEAMEEVTIMGVNVDRCATSGGIWLDAGELETLLEHAREEGSHQGADFLSELFGFFKKHEG